jgi:hypothetical protein
MRRRTAALAAASAALLVAGSASAAAPGAAPAPVAPVEVHTADDGHDHGHDHGHDLAIIDDESVMMDDVDCETAQLTGPEATSTGHLTGGDEIALDALILVDVAEGKGIAATRDPAQRAAKEKALFAEMRERLVVGQQSYAPLGIDLKLDRFALLAPSRATRTDDAQEIIDLAKAQYGGARPAGTDVVYVITDLDIQLPSLGNAVAGLADCIGGVANPDNAFAVGETQPVGQPESEIPLGPVTAYKDFTAKVFAHEVGHLMGGHHHYQECGVPLATAAQRLEPSPCSLMTNLVDFQTISFSQLNSIVVRGHAERWAD